MDLVGKGMDWNGIPFGSDIERNEMKSFYDNITVRIQIWFSSPNSGWTSPKGPKTINL